MTTLRLASGVCISSDNPSIIQQYLKYGAVEVKVDEKKAEAPVEETQEAEAPVEVKETSTKKKRTKVED